MRAANFFYQNYSIVFEKSKKGLAMETQNADTIRNVVRKRYGEIAGGQPPGQSPCRCGNRCGPLPPVVEAPSDAFNYSSEETGTVPDGINMGLGCGNPNALASLKPGETVLDLGCGSGFDCFLAAQKVTETGLVIGVDMTPEMLNKATENAGVVGAPNVQFRLGQIEDLPVENGSIDVIISNCVINLSPEKRKVFREAFRVLKPGGRLAVTDVVATAPLPEQVKCDLSLVAACIGGAESVGELRRIMEETGFEAVRITPVESSRPFIREWLPGRRIEDYVASATIEAVKPLGMVSGDRDPDSRRKSPQTSEIGKKAVELFKSGLLCAEVIAETVLDGYGLNPPAALARCASGFCGGMGGTSKELCGAFTGGVLALGCLLGRERPAESMKECGDLIKRFRELFLAEFGSLNCGALLEGFAKEGDPRMACVQLTVLSTQALLDLLGEFEKETGIDIRTFQSLPRKKTAVGLCPFSQG